MQGCLETLLTIIVIRNKGTAFEATLHNNCVNEVYVQFKGDMNCSKLLAFNLQPPTSPKGFTLGLMKNTN